MTSCLGGKRRDLRIHRSHQPCINTSQARAKDRRQCHWSAALRPSRCKFLSQRNAITTLWKGTPLEPRLKDYDLEALRLRLIIDINVPQIVSYRSRALRRPRSPLTKVRSRKAPSAFDQPVLKHHQSRSPLPHTKSQSAKESMPCISSPPMRHPRPTHPSGSLSCLERF